MTKLFILAAGGTGGHLFPAQAVAKELLARGHRVALVTDPRFAAYTKGFEGVEIHTLPMGKMSGGLKNKIIGALRLLLSIGEARQLLQKLKPAVVIGFGGYPSFPTMAAAIWLKLPTLIHEQNKRMGKVNRLLAKAGVGAIAASFPETIGMVAGKTVVTGNPVRIQSPVASFQSSERIDLLVFGGSQGARIFSEVVPEAIARLPEELSGRLRITQQARAEDGAIVVERYKNLRIIADIRPFFEDMPDHIARANLVICRSGASTVAEMLMAGRPAIYAPYPFAAENHQYDNAKYVVDRGAGWLLPDAEMTAEKLTAMLIELLTSPEKLQTASANASHLAMPEAAAKVAEMAEKLSGARA
jgi:UDP-N-acetylglucosamine--N-acetylmuramyl-(pentapeptide) pyrophosphoryl-undecaprenol N-acetylglucosamine transferase